MGDLPMSSNPPPGSPEPPPPTAPAETGMPAEIKQEDKTMAMLCHLLAIVSWFLGPLIVWLIKKDQSKFVDEQGKEALNFQITLLIGDVIGIATSCLIVGWFILLAVWGIRLVFCILAAIAVNKGEHYRYPFAIRLIK
jgi:uncharacterized Tic20 family protein